MKYNPSKIERKWQKHWEAKKLYEANDFGKRNFMLLAEFPYTSGNLHMGHWFTYSIADIYARYLRMNGYNVMYPIGFDAFGLPAENAAIKNNSTPDGWTRRNIKNMTKQLKSIGAVFDWSRVVDTSSPDYYKWTQWIFLQLYKKGLVYRGETMVNWCPKDKTVLANEQVVTRSTSSGQVSCCERCDTPVEQRKLAQWMFKITSFADALADDLNPPAGGLDWPEDTKTAQINWIGRSEGAMIKFKVQGHEVHKVSDKKLDKLEELDELSTISVFTTRPDTLFGVTAVIMSPELAQKWIDAGWQAGDEVKNYVKKSLAKRELERQEAKTKTGIDTGIFAINPANNEKVPVWVADYVLGHYGTGAIMAVPAHDERDREFAEKFDLLISDAPLGDSRQIIKLLEEKGLGKAGTNYRLHDWILSRQRYWGAPIPMVNCSKCALQDPSGQGYQPVPETELPVKLPKLADFLPVEGGKSPLARAEKWIKVKCPKCSNEAERETDTMDTFVDSSWYFIRYTDPKNKKEFASKAKMTDWLPVPMYIGGREHNTMHLLYARFIIKALNKLGIVNFSEPFLSRRNHGVIMGSDGKRMSKSRGNVVDPDVEVAKYGADTVRMNFAFLGPFEQDYAWNFNNISGISRFLDRVWNLYQRQEISRQKRASPKAGNKKQVESKEFKIKLHQTIKKVGGDISELKFNTCVSELMKLLNEAEKEPGLSPVSCRLLLLLLAPFAPHIAEELWHQLATSDKRQATSIHLEAWPDYDETLLAEEMATVAIQVNGKLRDTVQVKKGLAENDIKTLVLNREKIKNYLEGKDVKKIIHIQDRLVNVVTD